MGCRGPVTHNSCSTTKWNGGVSFPIGSGHGCLGCSEANFWDDGPLYKRLPLVRLQEGVGPLPAALQSPVNGENE
jgi:hydrogenase small subunit